LGGAGASFGRVCVSRQPGLRLPRGAGSPTVGKSFVAIIETVLTIVTISVTFAANLAHVRDVSGCDPTYGASAVPAGGLANRARAASGISQPALRPECEVLRWTGTGQGRVTPAQTASVLPRQGDDYRIGAPPRPRKHGLELSLRDDDSLWREPRWNADRCAHAEGCAAVPAARQVGLASVGVPLPFFFCSLA
jgi:hypothetical protein